ncbi:MAG TPA: CGNR zinc finger domain-containing protein, partial [Streptosporangiales bacterium]
ANVGRPRRPSGATVPSAEPVFPDAATTGRQLAPLDVGPVSADELPALRRLQQATVQVVEALLHGDTPRLLPLNTLAGESTAHVELKFGDGRLHRELAWTDGSPASALARRVIEELAALEPDRLRRCARTECDLLFYDTTRSRTRRWHAEDPCGWRERQRHRRSPP